MRTPAKNERGATISVGIFPTADGGLSQLTLVPNPQFQSEELLAYEVGYRVTPTEDTSLDIALFYNDYKNFSDRQLLPPVRDVTPSSPSVLPFQLANLLQGSTHGAELAMSWKPTGWLLLEAWYAYIDTSLAEYVHQSSPSHQASFRSHISYDKWEFDPMLRYVDAFPGNVPSHIKLDLRIAYSLTPSLELSIVGQNLLEDRHIELVDVNSGTVPSEVERGVFGNLTWSF